MQPALMQATSRESLRDLRAQLDRLIDGLGSRIWPLPDSETRKIRRTYDLADETFAVAALLDGEPGLRRALADPSSEAGAREKLIRRILKGKVSDPTLDLAATTVSLRWSSPGDIVDALIDAGRQTAFAAAEEENKLDTVEDELFRFGRILEANGELNQRLSDVSTPGEQKLSLVNDLVGQKVDPLTLRLLQQAVATPRGESAYDGVSELSDLAARRRQRSVAIVKSPVELTAQQEERLAAALGRIYGRQISVAVDVDPDVLGGLSVQVGDEVIDGTVAHRLDEVRRRFAG
jgi:F-type H+-transporting ATPase subunit delta